MTRYASNPGTGSNWTGRTPRTLQQACGPYASIQGEYRRNIKRTRIRRWTDAAMLAAAVTCFALGATIGHALLYGPPAC